MGPYRDRGVTLKIAVKFGMLTAMGALSLVSATASANSAAVDYFRSRADRTAVPSLLSNDERDYYRQLFGAIDSKDWNKVQQLLAVRADGPLHQQARAEYFLASGSPKIEVSDLQAWLSQGTQLPDADQISRLAVKRGATNLPSIPTEQRFARLPSMSKRIKPDPISDGTMPGSISAGILDRIKADDPMGARVMLDGIDATLSPVDAGRMAAARRVELLHRKPGRLGVRDGATGRPGPGSLGR